MAITEKDRENLFTPQNRKTLEEARDLLLQIMPEFIGHGDPKDHMLVGRTYHGLAQIIGYPDED